MENNLINSVTNKIDLNNDINQNKFLETSLGKSINTGIDIGLRTVLPDFIEDEVINIKDNLLKYGLKDGIKKCIDDSINIGKSAIGLITGNFENMKQVRIAVKNGGIIDKVSDLLDEIINRIYNKNLINYNTANLIKRGKNSILINVEKNIDKNLDNQIKAINYTEKYINNWKKYFNNKNFDGMELEMKKIKNEMNYLMPIQKMISDVKVIENLHTLIKNNGQDFNLSEDEIELAEKLK